MGLNIIISDDKKKKKKLEIKHLFIQQKVSLLGNEV